MRLFLFSLVVVLICGCLPPAEKIDNAITVDLSAESQQRVLNLMDERRTDLMMDYFESPYATERHLVAQAMGSIQDAAAGPKLLELLTNDPSPEVRYQAAYALGQIGDESIASDLVAAFGAQDSAEYNTPLRGAILESVGKIGSQDALNHIATVKGYTNADDHLLLGQMRGIYRYGLRGMTSPEATDRAVSYITDRNAPDKTRQLAASYLSRMRTLDLSMHIDTLITSASMERDPFVLMNMASAIARSARTTDLPALYDLMGPEQDYRVRVNAIRGLSAFPFKSYRNEVAKYINDDNEAVRLTAGSLIRDNATPDQSRYLFSLTNQATDERLKAYLLGGVLRSVPYYLANSRKRATNAAIQGINSTESPYTKSLFLQALAYDPINFKEVIQLGINADHVHPVSTSAVQLPKMLLSDKYEQVFRTTAARAEIEGAMAEAMSKIFGTGDSGAMAAAAGALRNSELPITGNPQIMDAMKSAITKLELPKETETLYEIEKTIAQWNGEEYTEAEVNYNHPIDWTILSDINDSSRVYIITAKGQIELQLFPKEAPGSVANFLQLIKDSYYDGNVIHRVAPNFVVQAGCPRGDGYGSLDYSIRSELGPLYYDDEGYLGMASAGKDTEGVQWFITHSPTPHLDGRYSIFGKVTKGMDVVHQLQIGDKIQDVRLLRDGAR